MSGSAHTPAVSVSHPMISDERLENATGRSRRHWYRELDEVGAQEWDRKRIARWLGVKREVDAWWAQALAIDYERDRGLRDGGRGRDGAHRASVTKTVRCRPQDVWPWIDDDDERRDWLDCEFEVRSHTPGTSLRLEAADGSRVAVSLRALPDAADGTPRTRVEVVHSGLLRADDLEETKAFWRAALTALASLVS